MNKYQAQRKTAHIIVLATDEQKARIRRMAEEQGISMSEYALTNTMIAVEVDEAAQQAQAEARS